MAKKNNTKPWYEVAAEKRGIKWNELSAKEQKAFMSDTEKAFKEKGIQFTPDDNAAMIAADEAFEISQDPWKQMGENFKNAYEGLPDKKFSTSTYRAPTEEHYGNDGGAFDINLPWRDEKSPTTATIPKLERYSGRAEHQKRSTAAPRGHGVPDATPKVDEEEVVDNGGGGGHSSGTANANGTTTGVTTTSTPTEEAGIFSDPNRPYWQALRDTYEQREKRSKFEFDDTYAPDSEGYRDIPGYLMDTGKTVIGAMGANKPLDDYDPSSDFKQMITESRDRRNMGITQQDRQQAVGQMDRAYNYDVTNIRNMAGGSGGAAMANLGGASQRYYGAQGQLDQIDQSLKLQNREQFYNAARAGEQVNQFGFQEKRGREMMSKMAAGELMADSMDNITHRKEYEDTYLKPGSQYYELMKEQNLGMREKRELLEFSQAEREKELNNLELQNYNLAGEELAESYRQEELAGGGMTEIQRANKEQEDAAYANRHERNGTTPSTAVPEYVNEDYREGVKAEGGTPEITSSADFNEYNGGPITNPDGTLSTDGVATVANDPNTGSSDDNGGYIPPQNIEQVTGIAQADLDLMTDEELKAEGMDRTVNKGTYTDPNTGKEIKTQTYNYGYTESMEGSVAPPTSNDQAYYDIENEINTEYSKKEKQLMDELYLKSPGKYKKEMKKLKEEKALALSKRQAAYLK